MMKLTKIALTVLIKGSVLTKKNESKKENDSKCEYRADSVITGQSILPLRVLEASWMTSSRDETVSP